MKASEHTIEKFKWISKHLNLSPMETFDVVVYQVYQQLKELDDYYKGNNSDE